MKTINLSDTSLEKLNNSKVVGRGSEGTIFQINEIYTIKLYTNKFENILNNYGKKISTLEKEASEMYDEKLRKLIERRYCIKHTSLPHGIVTYRGLTVGAILEYKKNHDTFSQFYSYNPEFVFTAFRYLNNITKELCDNYIYPTDLHPSNILIDLDSDKVEMIDTASEYIFVEDSFDEEKQINTYEKLANMLSYYLVTKITPNYDPFCFENHFRALNIPNSVIESILEKNVSFNSFNDILDYLVTNDTIKQAKTLSLKKMC